MPYKFIYFGLRGRAQHIRYLLQDAGIAYEDSFVTFDEWKDVKPNMTFGQLPALVDGKLEIVQTGSIVRHLARKHNLYGASVDEAAMVDQVHEGFVDEREKLIKLVFTKGDFDAEKQVFIESRAASFAPLEKLLKANGGGKGFFVGSKISFADYTAYDTMVNTSKMDPKCLDTCPLLQAFVARIAARPNMAKYISSEGFKKIVITPNPRLQ